MCGLVRVQRRLAGKREQEQLLELGQGQTTALGQRQLELGARRSSLEPEQRQLAGKQEPGQRRLPGGEHCSCSQIRRPHSQPRPRSR